MSPQRIQRRRTKGWRMPEGAVYVGRGTKWGNPFRVVDGAHGPAVAAFEMHALGVGALTTERIRAELAGKDLACWCPLEYFDGTKVPCHADVLLKLANERPGAKHMDAVLANIAAAIRPQLIAAGYDPDDPDLTAKMEADTRPLLDFYDE